MTRDDRLRHRSRTRTRSVLRLIRECAGFIFCEFFSNVGATGCRRGRTPERPLRQPSKGLADQARPFLVLRAGRVVRAAYVGILALLRFRPSAERHRAPKGHKLISQSVAFPARLALRWKAARFRFVIKRAGAERQGEGLRRHPMCLLRSRVRSPSSAGRRLAGNVPGESGGGGTSGSLSRQERESVPGVKRSQRCISRTA